MKFQQNTQTRFRKGLEGFVKVGGRALGIGLGLASFVFLFGASPKNGHKSAIW